MRRALPPAPPDLPAAMLVLVEELARLWAEDPQRLRPEVSVIAHWDLLVEAWANEPSLPLYVRKAANNRGSRVLHVSGRHLVPTDNSPAQWAFDLAVRGETPTFDDIFRFIQDDRIPVAMILKTAERGGAVHRCTLGRTVSPNSAGWKVCHVDGIGIRTASSLGEMELARLLEHFRKLMAPSNMFAIPLKYAGLGELPEFCHAIREFLASA